MNHKRFITILSLTILVSTILSGCSIAGLSRLKEYTLALEEIKADNLDWIDTSDSIGWVGTRSVNGHKETVLLIYDFRKNKASIRKKDSKSYKKYVSCINPWEKEYRKQMIKDFNPDDYIIDRYDSNSTGHIVEIENPDYSKGFYNAVGIVYNTGTWKEIINLTTQEMKFSGGIWLDDSHILLALRPRNDYYTLLYEYDLQSDSLNERKNDDGKQMYLYTADRLYSQRLFLSTDGSYIAYASIYSKNPGALYAEYGRRIIVQSLKTGKASVLFSEDESYAVNIDISEPDIKWWNDTPN